MKTFGRIIVIVAAFALVMGITYFAVNAGGNAVNTSAFARGGFSDGNRQFRGAGFLPNGSRPEFRGEGGRGGGGWMFGLIKNIGVVAFMTVLIVIPKNLLQQKKRQAVPVRIDN